MDRRWIAGLSVVLFAFAVANTVAETPEFETAYNKKFLRCHQLIGTKPCVQLHDATGQSIKLSSHGKYTVVVFGCLT